MKVITIAADSHNLTPLKARLQAVGVQTIDWQDANTLMDAIADESVGQETDGLILIDGEILACQACIAIQQTSIPCNWPLVCLTDGEETGLHASLLAAGVSAIVSMHQSLDAMLAEL